MGLALLVARRFAANRTPLAVLGTMGRWHRWSSGYGLRRLERLVRGFAPDLLCAEINRADWEAGRLAALPLEYRECLLPLCRELGITVVPVGDGWRGLSSPLRLVLALGAGPRWVNGVLADRWHRLWGRLHAESRPQDWALVAAIVEAVRRDPGRRVLVTVRMERRGTVVEGLRRVAGIALRAWP